MRGDINIQRDMARIKWRDRHLSIYQEFHVALVNEWRQFIHFFLKAGPNAGFCRNALFEIKGLMKEVISTYVVDRLKIILALCK